MTLIPASLTAAPFSLVDLNLVVGGNLTSNSEVEGRTLVAGNLSGSSSNYGIKLTPSSNYSDVPTLVVGGDITPGGALSLAAGDAYVGGSVNRIINQNGVGSDVFANNGSVGSWVTSTLTALGDLSSYFSGLSTTSSVQNPAGPSAVTFDAVAGAGNIAVFSVDGSIFSDPNSQQYQLLLGAGTNSATTYVFNVTGSSINFNQGNFVSMFTDSSVRPNIIWNFAEAENITLDRNWFGAILAPNANLANSTAIEGSVYIGGDFDQRGEVHLPLYTGVTDPGDPVSTPEPSTLGMFSIAVILVGFARLRIAKQ